MSEIFLLIQKSILKKLHLEIDWKGIELLEAELQGGVVSYLLVLKSRHTNER